MKLQLIHRRRWWFFYLPLLVGIAFATWWSATYWKILPPERVLIAAGFEQGSYAPLAKRYAEKLERRGLSAELVYSSSDQGSLERVSARGDSASVGFARRSYLESASPVQALAVVSQEPLWIFSGKSHIGSLAQAKGARVAAGPTSSPTWMAAKLMLQSAGLRAADYQFEPLSGMNAVNALIDGKIDIIFLVAGEDSQALQLLLQQPTLQIIGAERSATLAAQLPNLKPLLLPQGSIEFRGDIPPRDLTLMAMQTHLLVKPDTHPALQRLLLEAAVEIHEFPNFLQRQGEFPSVRGADFPVSPVAVAFSRGERPWMENLFQYGKAQKAELLLYAIVPLLLAMLAALICIPRLFDWHVTATLNRFYGKLKFVEDDVERAATDQPMALRGLLERLDDIERKVVELELPDEFSDRWYTLREHLASARARLLTLRAR